MSFIKSQISQKLWPPGKIASRNNICRFRRVRIRPTVPPFQRHSHQTKSGALDWNCVRMCPLPPLWWCADQTAQTFSIEESARWRAETTRHHALQAPTDRLSTATHCALHPSCALSCLFRVSLLLLLFSFFFCLSIGLTPQDNYLLLLLSIFFVTVT